MTRRRQVEKSRIARKGARTVGTATQLNIKNAEICALVRELIQLTGETQAEAVRKAVQERLQRERHARDRKSSKIFNRLMKVAERGVTNKLLDATSDHRFLYDANGAPI